MEKLSKFEKARILSARALQISDGAQVYIDTKKETDTVKLAEAELKQGKTPLKVVESK